MSDSSASQSASDKQQAVSLVTGIELPDGQQPRIANAGDDMTEQTMSDGPRLADPNTREPRTAHLRLHPSASVTPAPGLTGLVKRAFDVVAASLLLAVLSPLLLVICLLIRLDTAGPVIFRQRRTGLGGKVFRIYKFRSMRTLEDDKSLVQATRGDERITRVGRVLRRTSLDELPQLVNVLTGDMSLVGPRPHALKHDEEYGARLPTYHMRFLAKPGLTGLAQVTGWRGETDTLDKMAGRVAQDLRYVATWSPWLDVSILARTLTVPFGDPKAH